MSKRERQQRNLSPAQIRERDSYVIFLEVEGSMKDFLADQLERSDEARSATDVVRGIIRQQMRAAKGQRQ